jgi:hypothetical protein
MGVPGQLAPGQLSYTVAKETTSSAIYATIQHDPALAATSIGLLAAMTTELIVKKIRNRGSGGRNVAL